MIAPAEPTTEMIAAGDAAYREHMEPDYNDEEEVVGHYLGGGGMRAIWKAMLNASSKQGGEHVG